MGKSQKLEEVNLDYYDLLPKEGKKIAKRKCHDRQHVRNGLKVRKERD